MKELDPLVFFYVFQEMLGPLLWVLPLTAAAGIAVFVRVVLRDGRLIGSRLMRAELFGVAGGFAALALAASVTYSDFTDAGGPIDWLLVASIWGAGLIGGTILAYAVSGLLDRGDDAQNRPDPAGF